MGGGGGGEGGKWVVQPNSSLIFVIPTQHTRLPYMYTNRQHTPYIDSSTYH